jgi:hypothetical protein
VEAVAMCGYWIMPQRNCQLLKRFRARRSENGGDYEKRRVPNFGAALARATDNSLALRALGQNADKLTIRIRIWLQPYRKCPRTSPASAAALSEIWDHAFVSKLVQHFECWV